MCSDRLTVRWLIDLDDLVVFPAAAAAALGREEHSWEDEVIRVLAPETLFVGCLCVVLRPIPTVQE